MYNIPNFFYPEQDELFSSWLNRLSASNCFTSYYDFLECFSQTENIPINCTLKNDLEISPETLWNVFGMKDTLSTFQTFYRFSIFPAFYIFLPSTHQDRYVRQLYRSHFSSKKDTAAPLINDFHFCPLCQEKEQSNFGQTIFYRKHQLPATYICTKHNVTLKSNETKKNLLCPASKEIQLKVALFAENILTTWIPCNLQILQLIIKKRVTDLGYSLAAPYSKLCAGLISSHYSDMFHDNLSKTIWKILTYREYIPIEDCMVLLCFLFQTVSVLYNYLKMEPNYTMEKFYSVLDESGYTLSGPYNHYIVDIKHSSCNYVFSTTPHGFISGFSCPNCSKRISQEDQFKHILKRVGNGEYQLITKYHGTSLPVTLKHKNCSNELTILPSDFIYSGVRCKCEHQYTFSQIIEIINSLGNFKLLAFSSTVKPIKIFAADCGHEFTFDFFKFKKNPCCKICHPRIRNRHTFQEEISSIVGSEYTLTDFYLNKDTKVSIRHNVCGSVQHYYPRHFLSGERCRFCSTNISKSYFKKIIPELSIGLYEVIDFPSKSTVTLKEISSGRSVSTQRKTALQELNRPTPSKLLKNNIINAPIILPATCNYKMIHEYIIKNYSEKEIICLEDIQFSNLSYYSIKRSLQTLTQANFLKTLYPGVYCFSNCNFSDSEIVFQKYINRRGKQIGYIFANSFSFNLGLTKMQPELLQIVTNKESMQHGRTISIGSCRLKLRHGRTIVDDQNYHILPLLDLLITLPKYTELSKEEASKILVNYIKDHHIKRDHTENLFQFYPSYVRDKFNLLIEEVHSCDIHQS